MATGIQSTPPQAGKKKRRQQAQYGGLNKQQNRLLNQKNRADRQLGQFANQQLGGIQQAYSQPIDYSKGPRLAVQGDYDKWANQHMQTYNQNFDNRMNPIFARERENLDQELANKGIPMGSELYKRRMAEMQQGQYDAIQNGYAEGQSQATQNANILFQNQNQAFGLHRAEQMNQRNQPLTDYNNLQAAQSGMAMQNLGYSQQLGLQNNQADQSIRVDKATYRPPSGGGGGAGAMWQQYGFSNPMEFDAYRTQQARDQAQWEANLNNQGKPNPYAQMAGGLLGQVASAGISSYFGK